MSLNTKNQLDPSTSKQSFRTSSFSPPSQSLLTVALEPNIETSEETPRCLMWHETNFHFGEIQYFYHLRNSWIGLNLASLRSRTLGFPQALLWGAPLHNGRSAPVMFWRYLGWGLQEFGINKKMGIAKKALNLKKLWSILSYRLLFWDIGQVMQ